MKKITIYIVMALLCLNFKAQAQDNKAVDVTLKGIQIGQKVPDITIINLHNYKDANGKPSTTAKLSDFKGKLLILDFWATWCSPCVAMIPKMDSLQKSFGDKIQFLSITYQAQEEVMPFLEKFEKQRDRQYELPIATSSKELHQLFPHVTLPHYVWIDGKGKVVAITGADKLIAGNITKVLSGQADLARKSDKKLAHDSSIPFLANGNGGTGANLIAHSVITRFTEGLPAGYSVGQGRVTGTNMTMLQLFRLGYGGDWRDFGWNRTLVLSRDSASLRYSRASGAGDYLSWLDSGNGYCYEVRSDQKQKGEVFEMMRQDLDRYFSDYQAKVVDKGVKCWVLKRTNSVDRMASKGGQVINEFGNGCKLQNSTLGVLVARLESVHQQRSKYPLVDGSGYVGRVDLKLDADLSDMDAVNIALASYGLQFQLEMAVTPILEIRDRVVANKRSK